MHCPGGRVQLLEPTPWRVLAFFRTDSLPELPNQNLNISNPNPNPFGQSTLVYWLPYSSHTSHHPSQTTPCLPWISYGTRKTDAQFMQDGRKAVWSIPHVSAAFFTSLKHNFIAYRSSKVSSRPDCILKFTTSDNQALVGCIPIAAEAVHLNLES